MPGSVSYLRLSTDLATYPLPAPLRQRPWSFLTYKLRCCYCDPNTYFLQYSINWHRNMAAWNGSDWWNSTVTTCPVVTCSGSGSTFTICFAHRFFAVVKCNKAESANLGYFYFTYFTTFQGRHQYYIYSTTFLIWSKRKSRNIDLNTFIFTVNSFFFFSPDLV